MIGEIDVISNDTIIDIKCCQQDDIEYYSKQLYTYACLHRLRYGPIMQTCSAYNFLTGKVFSMSLNALTDEEAREHVCNLGSYCEYHRELFI